MSVPVSEDQIVQKQNEILQAMARIRVMRRGTLSRQSYPERARRKGGKGAVGPYALWQGTVAGKRFGVRVSGAEVEHIQQGIDQRHAFEHLCEEYIALSCQLASFQQESKTQEAVKKGLKSQPNKTRK
jgi:hypothetical protein